MEFPTDFTRNFLKGFYAGQLRMIRARMANNPHRAEEILVRVRFYEDRIQNLQNIEMLPRVTKD